MAAKKKHKGGWPKGKKRGPSANTKLVSVSLVNQCLDAMIKAQANLKRELARAGVARAK